ncbi:hypothetical protein ACGF8B_37835 [Streptomyces sp. NPDC047917]|uniref:hypothetical protein n=1 Tax=Streptomyces sp. NPDC047917 TaxID=3365491 RepID=UPI003717E9B4
MEDGEVLFQELGGPLLDMDATFGGLALGGAEPLDVRAGLAQCVAGVAARGAGLVGARAAFAAHAVCGRAAVAEIGSDSLTR